MSIVFELPTDIVLQILEWIPVRTFVLLDGATTSWKWRKVLLQLWANMLPLQNEENCELIRSSFYNWVHLRGMKLKSLFITPGNYDEINGLVNFNCDFTKVERAVFFGLGSELQVNLAMDIIKKCIGLRTFESRCKNIVVALPGSFFSKIPEMRLRLDSKRDITSVLERLHHCHSLVSLQLTMKLTRSYDHCIKTILANNPSLTHLDLQCSYLLLSTIAEHSVHITNITLDDVDDTECSMLLVTQLVKRPSLLRLAITCNSFQFLYICREYVGIMEFYDSTEDVCAVLSSVRGLSSIEFMNSSIYCPTLFPSLNKFSCSLMRLHLMSGISSCDSVQHLIGSFSVLEDLKLWILCDELQVLEIFSAPNRLKSLELVFENGIAMRTVCALIKCLPLLIEFAFEVVYRNKEEIEEFRDLMIDRYWSQTALRGHVGFVCDRVLRFKDGRFGGKHLDEYLTREEIEFERIEKSVDAIKF